MRGALSRDKKKRAFPPHCLLPSNEPGVRFEVSNVSSKKVCVLDVCVRDKLFDYQTVTNFEKGRKRMCRRKNVESFRSCVRASFISLGRKEWSSERIFRYFSSHDIMSEMVSLSEFPKEKICRGDFRTSLLYLKTTAPYFQGFSKYAERDNVSSTDSEDPFVLALFSFVFVGENAAIINKAYCESYVAGVICDYIIIGIGM